MQLLLVVDLKELSREVQLKSRESLYSKFRFIEFAGLLEILNDKRNVMKL